MKQQERLKELSVRFVMFLIGLGIGLFLGVFSTNKRLHRQGLELPDPEGTITFKGEPAEIISKRDGCTLYRLWEPDYGVIYWSICTKGNSSSSLQVDIYEHTP
jgi:hypothetical protein